MNKDLHNRWFGKLISSGWAVCLCLAFNWVYAVDAPESSIGVVTTASAGNSYTLPVSVSGFSGIGAFTLTIQFDNTRVSYVSASTHSSLPGMTVTYSVPSGNTGRLVLSWTGASNVSLADGSSLANLTFTYLTGTGNVKWWYYTGSVCQYQTYVSGSLVALSSSPEYLCFINGGISNRTAPVTHAPVITGATPGAVSVPITVDGFTNIGSLTLYLEYDPAKLTYNSFTANSAISSVLVSSVNDGSVNTMRMQWFGSAVNLADGTALITLNFTYITAGTTCNLTWFDNGTSCEYTDASTDQLIDLPTSTYYKNGSISGGSGSRVYLKNFLQGPYDASTHTMKTDLRTAGYLPLAQPYSGSPLNYPGTESVSSFNANVVDWVVLELRSGTSAASRVTRQAALLLSDGTIVGTDQSTAPAVSGITPGNAYYVVVYHRNHLPVMSATAITLPNSSTTRHDFTTNPSSNVYSVTNSGVIQLETGIYGQIAGELVYDNILRYSGANNDRGLIFARINELYTPPPAFLNSVITGYYREDLNMDGVVKYSGPKNDAGMIFSNIDFFTDPTILNSIYQGQVPISY